MPMPRGLRIGFPGPKVLLASTAIAARAWGFALNAAPQGSANDQGAFERAA
jgi:hypothetical protein